MGRTARGRRGESAALVLLGVLGLACGDGSVGAKEDARGPAREVRLAGAADERWARTVTVTGTLAAQEEVVLGSKAAGRLGEIAVDLGAPVRRGDVLARLEATDFRLRVQQADAALAQARARLGVGPGESPRDVDPQDTAPVRQARAVLLEARLRRDRAKRLFEEELLPRSDLDSAEASLEVAEGRHQDALDEVLSRQAILTQRTAELQMARQQLEDSVLSAPWDGAVQERHAAPGQYVTAGQPIVTLVRTHPLRLRLSVPERDAAAVRVGQEVRISIDGGGAASGRVARLSPALHEASRSLSIEAEIPNEAGTLRPGSFATADVVTSAEEPVVVVPASSVVTFAGLEKVLLVKEGKVKEQAIRTGRRQGDKVEVLEGLEAGQGVIVEPGSLVSGDPVAVAG